jgi:hypothetical protein
VSAGFRAAAAALATIAVSALLVFAAAAPADAHPMGSTAIILDMGATAIGVEVQVPIDAFEATTGIDVGENEDALSAAVEQNVTLSAPDGVTFDTRIETVRLGEVNGLPTIIATGDSTPPAGVAVSPVRVSAQLVIAQDPNHAIYVSITDAAGELELVGILSTASTAVTVATDSAAVSVFDMVAHGMQHIADGYDHLLFLALLLIVAPLVITKSRPRRWVSDDSRTMRTTVIRVLQTVTAFTIGHSITLLVVGLGVVEVPSQLVESAVALTIVATAIHALKPIFGRREAIIAGLFGLIHGSAFASTIVDLKLPLGDTLLAILGFNIGIELAQLIGVVLVVPFLAVAASGVGYSVFRTVIAAGGVVAGIGWFVGVQLGVPSVFEPAFEALAAFPAVAYAVFIVGMLAMAVAPIWRKRAVESGLA